MLTGKQFQRYSRQLMVEDFGEQGQERLLRARVLIVGLGGLGSPVALYLAAAGIGRLRLADQDRLDLTNLQRQILYRTDDCGQPKAALAQSALAQLNPDLELEAIEEHLDAGLLSQYVPEMDLVLDCTDNLDSRHAINRACRDARIPWISAAALTWEGQLAGFDFRHELIPCYSCLVPEGHPAGIANCASSGIIGPVLGVIGSMQALEAIRFLVSGDCSAFGQFKRYDGRTGRWLHLTIKSNPACPVCG